VCFRPPRINEVAPPQEGQLPPARSRSSEQPVAHHHRGRSLSALVAGADQRQKPVDPASPCNVSTCDGLYQEIASWKRTCRRGVRSTPIGPESIDHAASTMAGQGGLLQGTPGAGSRAHSNQNYPAERVTMAFMAQLAMLVLDQPRWHPAGRTGAGILGHRYWEQRRSAIVPPGITLCAPLRRI